MRLHRKNLSMDNKNFIKVYDNVIPHSLCDEIVEKFESNKDQWVSRSLESLDRHLSFKEIRCGEHMDSWKEQCETVGESFMKYVNKYKLDFSDYCFPPRFGVENFKIKKYEPNDIDEFSWHVDVDNRANMERFLSFFLYLSDNKEGKTEFLYQNTTVDCVKGSMVIFPPMWPWYHRGTKPIEVPKYFLGSYLVYVD